MLKNPFDNNQHWFRQCLLSSDYCHNLPHCWSLFTLVYCIYVRSLTEKTRGSLWTSLGHGYELPILRAIHADVIKWKHFTRYCPPPLCGEFTGHRWIPHTKSSDAELWCFLWSAPWLNGWVNNREAAGLRRQRAYHDVIVMRFDLAFPTVSRTTYTGGRGTFHLECFH